MPQSKHQTGVKIGKAWTEAYPRGHEAFLEVSQQDSEGLPALSELSLITRSILLVFPSPPAPDQLAQLLRTPGTAQ